MEMILLLHEAEPSGREARVNDQRLSTKQLSQHWVPTQWGNNNSATAGTAEAPR